MTAQPPISSDDSVRSAAGRVLSLGGEILGVLAQLLLLWLGAVYIWGEDDVLDSLRLLTWCLVATAYLGATVVGLNVLVRLDRPDPRAARALIGHPLMRLLSMVLSFGSSALGLTVAVSLITDIGNEVHDTFSEFSAIWAMLLSWAMFNWGFARIYFSRYHRAVDRGGAQPLEFPGTPDPRLVDFVYLAFTNATTFAVSDVQVTSTRMRWTIVWHTTIAFFFNALIIVLTMNVIANGRFFADLFA